MTKPMTESEIARAEAQEMLAGIAEIKGKIGELAAEYADKVRQIKEHSVAQIMPLELLLGEREDSLNRLMKAGKAALFTESDIVYLAAGQLLYAVVRRIAFPKSRDALIARLEKLGFTDAVKVKKSCDADVIEKWPDEKLDLAGLKRKAPEDTFNYSLNAEAKP
jgi:phage host-nuclease inhibitor protein Gam